MAINKLELDAESEYRILSSWIVNTFLENIYSIIFANLYST